VRHDERAREIILGDPQVPDLLIEAWGCNPERICRVIDELSTSGGQADGRLRGMLCGPLNPDRLDYIQRDSLHVGVPYGRAIDTERLLAGITFAPDGQQLCVSAKGVSAVETLIFASYLMYREVYWHHAVRAAQAMLKRAASQALLLGEVAEADLVAADDEQAMALLRSSRDPAVAMLMSALGHGRGLYRRVYSGTLGEVGALASEAARDLLTELAASDHWQAEALLAAVVMDFQRRTGQRVMPHQLLYDGSGRGKELFFSVPVLWPDGRLHWTSEPEVSLLAPSLATNFERHAKRHQLLAPPELAGALGRFLGLPTAVPEPSVEPDA